LDRPQQHDHRGAEPEQQYRNVPWPVRVSRIRQQQLGIGGRYITGQQRVYVLNTGELHWFWNTGATPTSWASYKSPSGQDANSTLAVGDASVPDCLKKGCTDSGWPAPRVPEAPFKGAPRSINGTIQAEDYDVGGQGVAYNVANGGSVDGAAYRTD
jgi:hypothetical protein